MLKINAIFDFMKYKVLFTLLLTFYGLTINAQTAEDSVKQTITDNVRCDEEC